MLKTLKLYVQNKFYVWKHIPKRYFQNKFTFEIIKVSPYRPMFRTNLYLKKLGYLFKTKFTFLNKKALFKTKFFKNRPKGYKFKMKSSVKSKDIVQNKFMFKYIKTRYKTNLCLKLWRLCSKQIHI